MIARNRAIIDRSARKPSSFGVDAVSACSGAEGTEGARQPRPGVTIAGSVLPDFLNDMGIRPQPGRVPHVLHQVDATNLRPVSVPRLGRPQVCPGRYWHHQTEPRPPDPSVILGISGTLQPENPVNTEHLGPEAAAHAHQLSNSGEKLRGNRRQGATHSLSSSGRASR